MEIKMIFEFVTESGVCVPAITTAQMREVDRIAIKETGPNLFQMMENAGRNLAMLAMQTLGDHWQKARILILAGSGGNGGGGICAARHLANHGGSVQCAVTNTQSLGAAPQYQRHIFCSTSGQEIELQNAHKPDLIIDAIIGYSLQSAPRGKALEFIDWTHSQNVLTISLDVPSGVDSTTGDSPGTFIKADKTLTLALPKTGLLPDKTGELYLGDIGIPAMVYKKLNIDYTPPFGSNYIISIHQNAAIKNVT